MPKIKIKSQYWWNTCLLCYLVYMKSPILEPFYRVCSTVSLFCILYYVYVRRKGWKLWRRARWVRAKLQRNLPIKHYQTHRLSLNVLAIPIFTFILRFQLVKFPPSPFYQEINWFKVISRMFQSICLDTSRKQFKYFEFGNRAAQKIFTHNYPDQRFHGNINDRLRVSLVILDTIFLKCAD